jgi:hypothetical protein
LIDVELLTDWHIHPEEIEGTEIGKLEFLALTGNVSAIHASEVNIHVKGAIEFELAKLCLEVLDGLNKHDASVSWAVIVCPLCNVEVTHIDHKVDGFVPVDNLLVRIRFVRLV